MNQRELLQQTIVNIIADKGVANITMSEVCAMADVPVGSFRSIMGRSFTDYISTIDVGHDAITVSKSRVAPKHRTQQILNAAVALAADSHYTKLTRDQIAEHAGVSGSLVTKCLGNMKAIRRDIMRQAVKNNVIVIIMQGLLAHDKYADKASPDQRSEARAMAVAALTEVVV